ncbi:MAG: SGNH/GDSL hydrolase family protein [Lachnospiraceae bacterium]|nr:SGNH/GDSL hydrolase family protein [Lachnospiraceae bacterium]
MRRTVITYLLFILAMSGFVALRIQAGKVMAAPAVTAPEPEEAMEETAAYKEPLPEAESIPVLAPPVTDDREYLWRGTVEPVSEFDGLIPRIVCWGDSLTVSLDGQSAYPDILRKLSGCEVINYGVESENTAMIAMRSGGLRVNVKATVIPSDTELIPIFLRTENDGHVFFLDNGDAGINPCSINGIEGELVKLNGAYYFKRSQKGERIAVDDGTQLKTFGLNDAKPDDVLVIFAGTNDLPDAKSAANIISLIRSMIDTAGTDKFIVVGLTYAGGIPEIDRVNEEMGASFGDHFVDIRKYMLNYGLEDAGIKPTSQDIEDINMGEIPKSLRNDYVHGNSTYHRLLGEQIYRRMQYMGYCR